MKVLVLSLFGILICAHTIHSAILGNRFVAETDVILNLYTRNNSDTPQVLANGDVQNLSSSYFQLDKPLKIFVHGWTKQSAYDTVVEAFLAFGDFNVVLVDWTAGAETGEVSDVVTNPPLVGVFLASFLDWLSTLGLPFSQIHIVGHSLGGHVVGFAGRNCKLGKIEYITALDPGLFYWVDSPEKINPDDGKYVEVIHTNAGISGLILPAGTADFYPNGGATNPGCDNDVLCDHIRSIEFFQDSIGHQRFTAQKCISFDEITSFNCSNIGTSYMGGTGEAKESSGVYYLTTNAQKPFYQG